MAGEIALFLVIIVIIVLLLKWAFHVGIGPGR